MTIWIITPAILVLSETAHSNLHTLQLIQSNYARLVHILETLVANHNTPHTLKSGKVKHSERGIIDDRTVENDLSHARVQGYQIIQIAHCCVRIVSRQIRVTSQRSKIYLSDRDEWAASSSRHVSLILEQIREIHARYTGHI